MVPAIRRQYNEQFTKEKYETFIHDLNHIFPGQLEFRVAETPLYIPRDFTQKVIDACESIIDVITSPQYVEQSNKAVPKHLSVPNENDYPHCIAFDFGICRNSNGEIEPQLIEMQGFPTLFAWQVLLGEMHEQHFAKPDGYSMYLNGFNRDSYINLLKSIILADSKPENVILLEIFPEQQKTRVDFFATERLLGIQTVCLTNLIQEGMDLFYEKEGRKIKIERIY
ncbi:MAG TPA: hypothetical protein VEX63_13130, partial [Flavisolibacter sp.]|nr:hypothetical protein [Flavisolibacter sp.]